MKSTVIILTEGNLLRIEVYKCGSYSTKNYTVAEINVRLLIDVGISSFTLVQERCLTDKGILHYITMSLYIKGAMLALQL